MCIRDSSRYLPAGPAETKRSLMAGRSGVRAPVAMSRSDRSAAGRPIVRFIAYFDHSATYASVVRRIGVTCSVAGSLASGTSFPAVSYTHLRAHETRHDL